MVTVDTVSFALVRCVLFSSSRHAQLLLFQSPQELFAAAHQKLEAEVKLVVHKADLVKAAVMEVVEMVKEKQEVVLSYYPSTGSSWTGYTSTKIKKSKLQRDSMKPAIQEDHLSSAVQPSGGISSVILGRVLGQFSKLIQDALCSLVLRAYSLLHQAICREVCPDLSGRGAESSQLQLKVWLKFIIPNVRLAPSIEEVEEMAIELSSGIAGVLHRVPQWGNWEGEEEREKTVDQLFCMQNEIKSHFKG